MYMETSSNIDGDDKIFVFWERTDNIQFTKITFSYNRFSNLTIISLKSMGRFRVQLLLEDDTWKTKFHMGRNSNYSGSSTHWSSLNLDFPEPNYGIRLNYDKIDTAHADVFFKYYKNTFCILNTNTIVSIKWIM